MRTDGRKQVKGKIIQLPEGTVTVLKESEPMMVLVGQKLLVERMDSGFWAPVLLSIEGKLYQFGAQKLKDLISPENLVASDHVRDREGEKVGAPPECDVEYYTVAPVMRTGYDLTQLQYCDRRAYERLKSTSVRQGDILIADSGVAGIGRLCFVSFKPSELSCTGHLFVLHPEGIDGRFLTVFLHSMYGQAQIHRRKHGVASPYIKREDLLEISVPTFSDEAKRSLNHEHQLIEAMHRAYVKAKSEGKFNKSERYLQIAEGMLESLIVQVEWLIEGEQDKVIPLLPDNAPQVLKDEFIEQYRRIGETTKRAEYKGQKGVEKIYGMRIYANPIIRDAIRRLLTQVEEVMAGRRRKVEPVL